MKPRHLAFTLALLVQATSGCSQISEDAYLANEALHIQKLPIGTEVIDSNFQSGPLFDFYEYYLKVDPMQYKKLFAGRSYQPCETQRIKSHDAFSSFNSHPNTQLVSCVKAISKHNSIAIYRDDSSSHVFITFNESPSSN